MKNEHSMIFRLYIILLLVLPGLQSIAQSGSHKCGFNRTDINCDLTYSEVILTARKLFYS